MNSPQAGQSLLTPMTKIGVLARQQAGRPCHVVIPETQGALRDDLRRACLPNSGKPWRSTIASFPALGRPDLRASALGHRKRRVDLPILRFKFNLKVNLELTP